MPTVQLSKRFIDEEAVPKRVEITNPKSGEITIELRREHYWDDVSGKGAVQGLALRVEPSGTKVFYLKYRSRAGTQRWYKIGRYGRITLHQARETASIKNAEVALGEDPSRDQQTARKGDTVDDACDLFLEEHVSTLKPTSRAQYTAYVDKYIRPKLGKKKVVEVTEHDISLMLHGIGKTKPTTANRVRAVMSKLFSMCESRWKTIPRGTNPVTDIEKYEEKKRHRDMSNEELSALAEALDVVSEETDRPRCLDVIRLLLFTGCRRGEIMHLRWSEVDLNNARLSLVDSKTGPKTVYLNSAAVAILTGIKNSLRVEVGNLKGPVFPAYIQPVDGETRPMPEWELREVWMRVREVAELEADADTKAFRLHDLRHTFATLGAGEGLSLPQIGKLLGHKHASTTERYADLVDGPNRRAVEQVGQRITEGMKAKKATGGEVAQIHPKDDE